MITTALVWREWSKVEVLATPTSLTRCVSHLSEAGWQKLHGSTGGTRRKVWTQTKILSPNIRYFVAN